MHKETSIRKEKVERINIPGQKGAIIALSIMLIERSE